MGSKGSHPLRKIDRDIKWVREYDAGLEAGEWATSSEFAIEKKVERDTMSKALSRRRAAIDERESVNRPR